MRREATPDRELVERANRGDAEAFETIYRQHREWVVSLAWRFTGNCDDALDVLQDCFTYLFRQFPGFVLTSTLRAYLYPVVKHTCLSLLRKRRPVVDLEKVRQQGLEAEIGLCWEQPEPSDLDRIVAALPEGQREVVRLRFGFDLKLSEIAEALGLKLGTVKSRLHHALQNLRESLHKQE